jgi:branched-chain amino acid transport system permease protein
VNFWILQSLNSLAFGGLLFLLASGFSLIFGLMRIANLAHGSFFMLGAYVGVTAFKASGNFGMGAMAAFAAVALIGLAVERGLLRRLADNELGQILTTIGITYIVADAVLGIWTGNALRVETPETMQGTVQVAGVTFPVYRLAVFGFSCAVGILLRVVIEGTRAGAMLRAGVDDMQMARGVGIPVSRVMSAVFILGSGLAGLAGALAGPILSAYATMDHDVLPLALVVVILGGVGSLTGSFVGSMLIGFIYTFGQTLFPSLAYVALFLPMVLVLVFRPQGLFGRPL